MEVAKDVLEFLDLKLKFDKYKRISVDILVKATNSFTYVLPSTSIVALRLRRICDSDDKFEERSVQYQKCLVARDYKVKLVKLKNSFQMSETFQGSKLGDLKTTIFQLHAT